jgi:hypothetical protein
MSSIARYYFAGFLAGFGACDVIVWLSFYGQPTFFRSPGFFVFGLLLMSAGAAIRWKGAQKRPGSEP